MPNIYSCIDCRYFEPFDDEHGECRINPPIFVPNFLGKFKDDVMDDLSFITRFPVVHPDSGWCGQFSIVNQASTA